MKIYFLILPALLSSSNLFADSSEEELKLLREISAQTRQFNEKLAETQKRLDVLEKKLEFQSSPSWELPKDTLEKLQKIKLPENPDEEQVAQYIKAIQQATGSPRSISSSDMQIQMYRKIGPGHLKTFLALMDRRFSFHMQQALPSLVGDNDKEFVLSSIEKYPFLLPFIYMRGWTAEASPRIWEVMKTTSEFSWFQPFLAGKTFTQEQQKMLIEIFCANPSAGLLAPIIEQFPDTDLAAIAEKAWNTHKKTSDDSQKNRRNQYYYMQPYAVFAAKYTGNTDALLNLAEMAAKERFVSRIPGYNLTLPVILHQLTGQGFDSKKVLDWVKANKDKLVFDKTRQCFALQPER